MEEIIRKVEQSINEIRPYLQADGGDISLVEISPEYVVKVKLLGACGCCPHSMQTLKLGVEDKIRKDVPIITEVQAI